MLRTVNNNELTIKNVGEKHTLVGWCSKKRNLGGLLFIDLRDRYGITQLVCKPENENYEVLSNVKNEYVLNDNLNQESSEKDIVELTSKYQEYLKAIERGDSATAEKLMEEYKKLAEQAIGEVPQISEDATKEFQNGLLAAGEDFRNLIPDWLINSTKDGAGLSSLQKGIQGITEQTAQVLEAYLNSVRMYVATISADTTSQLNEVRAIHTLLTSVVYPNGHNKGGAAIKVFADYTT